MNMDLNERVNYNSNGNSVGSWKDKGNGTANTNSLGSWKDDVKGTANTNSLGSWKDEADGWAETVVESSTSDRDGVSVPIKNTSVHTSWADMAQEDKVGADEVNEMPSRLSYGNSSMGDGTDIVKDASKPVLSRQQREYIRFANVKRKKDFICIERVKGKIVNILDGLELHTSVFSAVEQKRIVDCVYKLQEMGKKGELKERTYTTPVKWMRGKGRVTIQFGCCYNYAPDKNDNPPGILRTELVDTIPHLFKVIIRRLVKWHVLPVTCVPDSCIVNIYDEEDCIPPHIDNHDFVRPFCTVSFLSECNIVFGSNLKVVGPGEFAGSIAIPLPVGSVLVLSGNGADVAKHCVPAVPTKRISITFRKMEESKWPMGFVPEPDLQGIQPLTYGDDDRSRHSDNSKSDRPLNLKAARNPNLADSGQRINSFYPKNPIFQFNQSLNHRIMGSNSRGSKNYRNPCLTMHQPWASLLVHGIKRIEGRSWPSPITGRLWIHAAGKVPDQETIKAMEDFYKEIYAVNGITDIKFPDNYPTSRLLGCVEVVGCVTLEELRCWEGIPEGVRLEGQTKFCWLCEQPQKLIVPFEMRGSQGVYNLERETFDSAIKGLSPIEAPIPIKFPNRQDHFSLEPRSLVARADSSSVSEIEKRSPTLTAAISGARLAANQFSKQNQ